MTPVETLQDLYNELEDNAMLSRTDLRTVYNAYSTILDRYRDKGEQNKEDTFGLKSHLFQINQWIVGARNKSGDDYFDSAKVDLGNGIRELILLLSKDN